MVNAQEDAERQARNIRRGAIPEPPPGTTVTFTPFVSGPGSRLRRGTPTVVRGAPTPQTDPELARQERMRAEQERRRQELLREQRAAGFVEFEGRLVPPEFAAKQLQAREREVRQTMFAGPSVPSVQQPTVTDREQLTVPAPREGEIVREARIGLRGRVLEEFVDGQRLRFDEQGRVEREVVIPAERGTLEQLQSRLETRAGRETDPFARVGQEAAVFGLGAVTGVVRGVTGFIDVFTKPREVVEGLTSFARDPSTPLQTLGEGLATRPAAVGGEVAGTAALLFVPPLLIGRLARLRASTITPRAVGVGTKVTRTIVTGPEGVTTEEVATVSGRLVGRGIFGRQRVVRIGGEAREVGRPSIAGLDITELAGRQKVVAEALPRGPRFAGEQISAGIARPRPGGEAVTRVTAGIVRPVGKEVGITERGITSTISGQRGEIITTTGTFRLLGRPTRAREIPALNRKFLASELQEVTRPTFFITGRAKRIRREFLFETPERLVEFEQFKGVGFAVRPEPLRKVTGVIVEPLQPRKGIRDLFASKRGEFFLGRQAERQRAPLLQSQVSELIAPAKVKRAPRGIQADLERQALITGRETFKAILGQETRQITRVGVTASLATFITGRAALTSRLGLQARTGQKINEVIGRQTPTPPITRPIQIIAQRPIIIPRITSALKISQVPVTRQRQVPIIRPISATARVTATPFPTFFAAPPPFRFPTIRPLREPVKRGRRRGVKIVTDLTPSFQALALNIRGPLQQLRGTRLTGFELRPIPKVRPRFTL